MDIQEFYKQGQNFYSKITTEPFSDYGDKLPLLYEKLREKIETDSFFEIAIYLERIYITLHYNEQAIYRTYHEKCMPYLLKILEE